MDLTVSVPPYCGTSWLEDVVIALVVLVVVGVVAKVVVGFDVVVSVVVGVDSLPHDTSNIDNTIRQLSTNHGIFFFILFTPN
jgi:hypothetical protein